MAKQSARFRAVKSGNRTFVTSYQKKEVVNREMTIAAVVQHKLPKGFQPYDCPVRLDIDFIFPMPNAMPKKLRQVVMEGGAVYKDTKPDNDNCTKGVMDAVQGILFVNDSRVAILNTRKYYGPIPKTIINVTKI
ncbi:RusA family crossover junction endodeoxyribonuclease [Niabella sp. CC-SYL272]|uniref:RusA family crossover junction endodeoxyribonuclease n=1 Tax=Niabella agricola TaxID=2891571 RepID=UPI0021084210|nr:RusA family crossover junction endodeoxyribonuclease [Niabella agricola]MCF3107282.1 RusA family crossover junction endodeoxyribonuclease [Niabella agricola]